MPKTNPNGANQYVFDPRQKLCWELYATPGSDSFGNATQSAIKAGYTPKTANKITTEDWFVGKLRRLGLLSKAEKVLEETLTMDDVVPMLVGKGEEAEYVTKRDPQLTRIKQDSAKFIASTQGKDHGYSTRSELTGADGQPLVPHDPVAAAKAKEAIDKFLGNERDPKDTSVQ